LEHATEVPVHDELEYSAVQPINPPVVQVLLQFPPLLGRQGFGVGEGDGVAVGVGEEVGDRVGVGLAEGVGAAVGLFVGVGAAVGNGDPDGIIVGEGEPSGISGNAVNDGFGSSAEQIISAPPNAVSQTNQVVYPSGQTDILVLAVRGT